MKGYITLLSSEKYFAGVVAISRMLQGVKSKYPLYCALSIDISKSIEERLEKQSISCIRLTKKTVYEDVNPSTHHFSNWNFSFDKFQIWGLTQFEKLVFVDADMLILRNLDSLFELPAFSGVCAGKSYPGHEKWSGINSGLMVVVPDKNVEVALTQLMPSVVEDYRKKGLLIGDQDVLQRYLSNSWNDDTSLHLDEGYNIFADYLTYYVKKLGYSYKGKNGKPIYIVHFIGKLKPWMDRTLRNRLWLLKMWLRNPYYFLAYYKVRSYLKAKY